MMVGTKCLTFIKIAQKQLSQIVLQLIYFGSLLLIMSNMEKWMKLRILLLMGRLHGRKMKNDLDLRFLTKTASIELKNLKLLVLYLMNVKMNGQTIENF
jgi:hypothetical protein